MDLGSHPSLTSCRVLQHPHSWAGNQRSLSSSHRSLETVEEGLPTFSLDPTLMPLHEGRALKAIKEVGGTCPGSFRHHPVDER